jgi:nucleoside-diphosphate-sugar epimerase
MVRVEYDLREKIHIFESYLGRKGFLMVLITGASGFVGSSALKYLISRGYKALGTVRHSSDLRRVKGFDKHLRFADMTDFDALMSAMNGCSAVVHCAARSLDWGKKQDFWAVNVQGVQNIVNAAVETKSVRRVVYISTANVAGFGKRNMVESSEVSRRLFFLYSRTKLEGERTAQTLCRKKGIEIIVLRPSAVYGPEDWKWSYEMIDRIAHSYWPLINSGRALFTPVYIENLNQAIELALKSTVSGGIFNITDDITVSWREFCEKIANHLSVPLKYRNFTSIVALIVATLIGSFQKIFKPNKPPDITLYRVLRSTKDFHYSCEHAKNTLEYKPDSDIDSHIKKTVKWYLSVTDQ